MRMKPFILLTFIGATLWCGILVALGYFFWEDMIDIMRKYGHELTYITFPLIAFYLWWKIFRK
jgi:membrane protein DedA with SNARE-associated domain